MLAVSAPQVLDGLCLLFSGTLLLFPGFITDAVGSILFVPVIRHFIMSSLTSRIETYTSELATQPSTLTEKPSMASLPTSPITPRRRPDQTRSCPREAAPAYLPGLQVVVVGHPCSQSAQIRRVMSDEFSPTEDGTQPKEVVPPVIVNAQYTKDLFGANGARIFAAMQKEDPDVKIGVNVDFMEFEDNIFEVVLKVEATCTVGTETAFRSWNTVDFSPSMSRTRSRVRFC